MKLQDYQEKVDDWIKSHGVRYFDIKTNTLILNEEVGELSSLIARVYGEQSFKTEVSKEESDKKIKDEVADIFFVLTCICNQQGYSIEKIIADNFEKKTKRDSERHKSNPKLLGSS